VGANGVGKSTLLAAINFCLTGTVSDPYQKFESMDEYLRFTRDYSKSYFTGRIDADDIEFAEISLNLSVAGKQYEISRGLFEPDELRSLRITQDGATLWDSNENEATPAESQTHYATQLIADIGLSSFAEFVFLQLFVFTFDEQRKLVLWHQRLLERTLYLAFGIDPGMATNADLSWRMHEKADSRVRNIQWEYSKLRKRVNELVASSSNEAGDEAQFESLKSELDTLRTRFEQASTQWKNADSTVKDASLELAELTMQERQLREKYSAAFEEYVDRDPSPSSSQTISETIANHRCVVCGSKEESAIAFVNDSLKKGQCPLCHSEVRHDKRSERRFASLKKIDADLTVAKKLVDSVLKKLQQAQQRGETLLFQLEEARTQLDQFEDENNSLLEQLRVKLASNPGEIILGQYMERLKELQLEKAKAMRERSTHKSDLLKLQKTLANSYESAETSFVPKFRSLAQHFLGMPLDIRLDAGEMRDLKLVLDVMGSARRQEEQLSESQRFFLDIAFRMAIIQYVSPVDSSGTLYLDTPEGSLDIAYEKRAGEMLSNFAAEGHSIVMTANLNSSQLLIALARKCSNGGIDFIRMMDWAELTDVQREEGALFNDAFAAIQSQLSK
jgi:DNA repair exonuclease SbcCD ATPase subunit